MCESQRKMDRWAGGLPNPKLSQFQTLHPPGCTHTRLQTQGRTSVTIMSSLICQIYKLSVWSGRCLDAEL